MINYDRGRELLKWIAIITMTIDHIGVVLYPQYSILRVIGRISFPLFAYLLVLGMESTRNLKGYFNRLFIFALISQIPFSIANSIHPWEQMNIFFTLSLGLISIYFLERNTVTLFIPLIASVIIPVDYGAYGIATIIFIYILRKNKSVGLIIFTLFNLILFIFNIWYQPFAILALPLILLHHDKRYTFNKIGRQIHYPFFRKYFFYIYYPLHLLVLSFLKIYI